MDFKVSIIIPAYNAETFIEDAVNSAIMLHQVGEIIIVDDGSIDNTLALCKRIAREQPNVKVLNHKQGLNKGVSATRNLGIKSAKFQFIAFLDADDIYLPNRFQQEEIFFEKYPDIDGVYGATATLFMNEEAKKLFEKDNQSEFMTMKECIEPENLFEELLWQHKGQFTTNAVTLKKSIFLKSGLFNPQIKLGEDSDLWYRVSAVGKLMAGDLTNPVSMRRIHENNTIHTPQNLYDQSRRKYYKNLIIWAIFNNKVNYNKKNISFIVINAYKRLFEKNYSESIFLFRITLLYPLILFSSFFWRKLFQMLK